MLTGLVLGSPPCVSERASGIEGKPGCKRGGWGRSGLWLWLLLHPCTGSHRGWCTRQGSTRGTGRIWLHHPTRVQQPLTAEHSNPLIRCRARLSEPQSPRGGISNKTQEREMRVENVWLFVSLLAGNTSVPVLRAGVSAGTAQHPRALAAPVSSACTQGCHPPPLTCSPAWDLPAPAGPGCSKATGIREDQVKLKGRQREGRGL